MKKNRPSIGEIAPYFNLLTKIGLKMAVSIIIGFTIGYQVESKLYQAKGAFIILFTFLGVGVGLYQIVKEIQNLND